jgi:hypothetical protein
MALLPKGNICIYLAFLLVATYTLCSASHHRRHRRASRIVCVNGTEVNGACFCNAGYVGTHCEKKMYCNSYERNLNGSCRDGCQKGYVGERCELLDCVNGIEDDYEQKCNCEKPYTGLFCNELITKNVYYLYNSKMVAMLGPLGALALIPMVLVFYGCEHFAKKRQVRRIEQIWGDHTNASVDSDRIKSILDEKA